MSSLEDFECYVAKHGIPEEHCPAAFARWIAEVTGGGARFENVEPGDEQILPRREQRELDALPSGLGRKREA